MRPLRARLFVLLSAGVLLAPCAFALPEDRQQPLTFEASSSEMLLDRGISIHRGTAERPAVATQGTMKISGLEITVEQSNGAVTKVTATGMPARFQQQPEANKPVVHISGNTLVFDNVAQIITADGNAESNQGGNTLSGDHLQYNIQTRTATADAGSAGGSVNMFIPPAPADAESADAAPDAEAPPAEAEETTPTPPATEE